MPEEMTPQEKGFHAVRDAEAETHKATLLSAIGTLGLPGAWARALSALAPIAADTAAQVVKATHEESPGGGKITKDELKAIARREALKVEVALFKALLPMVGE